MMPDAQNAGSLLSVLELGRTDFKSKVDKILHLQGGFSLAQYSAFLGMQVHLTKEVQRYFFRIAAHPDILSRTRLRSFAINFGIEEAPHYEIAIKDIEELGQSLCAIPFWVEAWHAYFFSIVDARPFVRLGAACFLENVATTSSVSIEVLLKGTRFLTPKNTRFIAIHKHESTNLNHGEQILEEMEAANLIECHWADLTEGAEKARILYGQMCDWAMNMR
jgi:hypothetical protein